jgi:hypothetical protein
LRAYEEMLAHTSTECAPWYVIPADRKWFTRAAIADVLVKTLKSLHFHYPVPTEAQIAALAESKRILEAE